jgi:hypothetical protein
MSPVSVVANPTFGSRRWIGPESVAENGPAVAVGDADGEVGPLGDATASGLPVGDPLGPEAGASPAHAVTSSATRHIEIRTRSTVGGDAPGVVTVRS